MSLEARVQALLELVEADRARRCGAIARDARQRMDAIRAAARATALQRLRAAIAEGRERREAATAAAQAKLQTHRRLHDQRRAAAWLAEAWRHLPDALHARWLDPVSRQAWVWRVLDEARTAVGIGPWRILHAALPDEERERVASRLAPDAVASLEWIYDGAIRAGLKVCSAGNVIDGTIEGLVTDRSDIAARLLRHMEDG